MILTTILKVGVNIRVFGFSLGIRVFEDQTSRKVPLVLFLLDVQVPNPPNLSNRFLSRSRQITAS